MRRTKTLASLVAALVFALTVGGYAYAHPLGHSQGIDGFESDISEDGVINVCNPRGVRADRVVTAIAHWNAITAEWGKPTLRMVTPPDCEVTVVEQGGANANFYARMLFTVHPDRLQISDRIKELSVEQRQAIITHELGHVLGLEHPPADEWTCANSVMTTIEECKDVGMERLPTPGLHDKQDLEDYWVEEPIYPKHNKCWEQQANGKCTKWAGSSLRAFGSSSRDGGGGAGRTETTGGPSSAVRIPDELKVIKD
jgi:dual-action HEIGH metallo-peptidase